MSLRPFVFPQTRCVWAEPWQFQQLVRRLIKVCETCSRFNAVADEDDDCIEIFLLNVRRGAYNINKPCKGLAFFHPKHGLIRCVHYTVVRDIEYGGPHDCMEDCLRCRFAEFLCIDCPKEKEHEVGLASQ